MIEWQMGGLPTADGQYIVWLTDLCAKIVWFDAKKQTWEITRSLKVKGECQYIEAWSKINSPMEVEK